MEIKLIEGQYPSNEALDLVVQLIHVKIKFHENKISAQCSEEDIKFREARIKQLHKILFDIRHFIEQKGSAIELRSNILLQ